MKCYYLILLLFLIHIKSGYLYADESMYASTIKNTSKNTSKLLKFLYSTTTGSWLRVKLIRKKWFSELSGFYCNRSMSKLHIHKFIKKHNINIDEMKKDIDDFMCFNDFFTRELKDGSRSIDWDEKNIISPADGKLLIIPSINNTKLFKIKDITFSLKHFLNNKQLAEQYQNGLMVIIRLSPWDYHRFHFPCKNKPTKAKLISGNYESVNPLAFEHRINSLVENERHLIALHDTPCDTILMIPIGAMCVGKIKETYTPNIIYQKADQAGYFCFGGSTVVLLFKKNTIELESQFIELSAKGIEIPVKMGQKIGTVKIP